MAWKNATSFAILLCLLVSPAWAKSLWRVESSEKAEAAPLYQRAKTPFPVKEAPRPKVVEVKKVEEKPRLTLEELEKQRRSRRATQLLGDIRGLISAEEMLLPDVAKIEVDGRIKGEDGYRILVNEHWLSKGDIITVPVVADDEVWSLVSQLEILDSELSETVATQVEERVFSASDLDLVVKRIEKEVVILVDRYNQEYKVFLDFKM